MVRIRPSETSQTTQVSTKSVNQINSVNSQGINQYNTVQGVNDLSKYYADLAKQYAEQAIVNVNSVIDEVMENITGTGSIKPEYNNRVLVIKDITYVHNQVIASNAWTIQHNMNKYPSVTVVDSSGRTWFPPVDYVDENTCIANFLGATTGKAYCN